MIPKKNNKNKATSYNPISFPLKDKTTRQQTLGENSIIESDAYHSQLFNYQIHPSRNFELLKENNVPQRIKLTRGISEEQQDSPPPPPPFFSVISNYKGKAPPLSQDHDSISSCSLLDTSEIDEELQQLANSILAPLDSY